MVNVRKKSKRETAKTKQTSECRLSSELSGLQLNSREGSDSVANEKTLSNSARESRKSERILGARTTHNGAKPKHEVFVFVLSKAGAPLMPTHSAKARRMLQQGLAKVVRRTPFVIQMLVETRDYVQQVDAGLDAGAKNIGVAARVGAKVLYAAIVQTRQQEISSKMSQRSMYRRNRRGRKLRYRQPRFLNRASSRKSGRLPPSVRHVLDAHEREIRFVESILPNVRWHFELASFDIHAITNPEVSRFSYAKGRMHGFANTKAYVLSRDSYKCASSPKHDGELHAHHIRFRSNGGTDSPDNLITLCMSCHDKLHSSKNAQEKSLELRKKKQNHTASATIVSTISAILRRRHEGRFIETFGYETKIKRGVLGFPKDHYVDALLASTVEGEVVDFPTTVFCKRLVSQGDYQQTSGAHSQQKIPTGKLFGFRKFDLITTEKGVGFVKGKRSSGYFAIAKLDGTKVHDSVNVKKTAKRLAARKTVLVEQKQKESASVPLLKQGVSGAKN